MPQYIFSLNKKASQGATQLAVGSLTRDKLTGVQITVEGVLRPGVLVSTLNTVSIPDSTTISNISIEAGEAIIELTNALTGDIESGEDILFNDIINRINEGRVGLDRRPVAKLNGYLQLADIVTGDSLVDDYSNPLVTEGKIPVRSQATAAKALSLAFNTEKVIKVEEVFPETSEVSTSLLGVPKSETQLGLFSDVSVLGLDEDIWEYKLGQRTGSYAPWERRKTRNQDDHYPSAFREAYNQQALELTCFPPPYKYPWQPPNTRAIGTQYSYFKTFIELGNNLYNCFKDKPEYGSGFVNNFLDPDKVKIGTVVFQDVLGNITPTKFYREQLIIDGITEQEGFLLIDIWTNTLIDINANALIDITTGLPFTTKQLKDLTGQYREDENPFDTAQPGYEHSINDEYQNEVLLQSKRSFRYQPGRISGFTFGVKASSDSGSENNIVEWGTYNPTDQYLFQIRGASINIVRRSTIPLPDEVLETYGLTQADQTVTNFTDTTTGRVRDLYEVVIPRGLWNVDSLDGNGPSRYLLTSKQVTMYKIEFSWYGAIGANFYAYIPVENNECRWVLLNKLIIENKMGKVCLEDPFFKFRYYLKVRDPKNLKYPQFLYKYGASYYIDGGDEGSNTLTSATGEIKTTSPEQRSILLGVHPKESISNAEGVKKKNKKTIIPTDLTVTSTSDLAKIDVVTCKACPGYGYTYEQGLSAKDTLSNHITFYYSNLENTPTIRTKYIYPILNIDYSTTSVTITAENYPNKFRQGSSFRLEDKTGDFTDLTTPIYRIDNVIVNSNNTITFNVSSTTGVFPSSPIPTSADLELKLHNQLFTIKNNLNKILVEGLYGYYTDMAPITANNTYEVDVVDGVKYYDACNLYKTKAHYTKQKITQQIQEQTKLFTGSAIFNWTQSESLNPLISGGLGLFTNNATSIKIINHDYYVENESTGDIAYYPRDMVVSNWNTSIAASDHPIQGVDTDIQFLIPHIIRYDSRHVADFVIGVTTKKPVQVGDEVKFDYNGEYRDLDDRDFLSIEYTQDYTWQDLNFDSYEVIHYHNERLIIDREMPILNYSDGGGACSKINLTLPDVINITNCNYKTGAELIEEYGVSESLVVEENNYIITTDSKLQDPDIDFIGGETGINGEPGGTKFTTTPAKVTFEDVDYYYIGVTDVTAHTDFNLNLSYIRLTFPTGDGILHKKVEIVGPNYRDKIFNFNPYPLYLVIKMVDRSKVNSINIKENFGNTQQVTSPKWLYSSNIVVDNVKGKAPSNEDLGLSFPENFISKNRLDACSYDIQGNRTLRESTATTKASYYIGPSETKKINLNSVFGLDKTVVTQDLYGLDAIFITGQSESQYDNQVQVTLNISEQ